MTNESIEVTSAQLRRLRLFRDIGAILVVFISLAFVVVTTVSNRRQDSDAAVETRKNRDLIVDLQAELEQAAATIEAKRSAEADIVECTTRFTYAIQAASAAQLSAIGDLVVVITRTVPGPDREATVTNQIDLLEMTNQHYKDTILARIAYDKAEPKLPCPLQPGLNG